MVVLGDTDQAKPEQGATLQIEWKGCFLAEQFGGPGLRIGIVCRVGERDVKMARRVDDLERHAFPLDECGAQRLVASDAVLEGGVEGLEIEGSVQ